MNALGGFRMEEKGLRLLYTTGNVSLCEKLSISNVPGAMEGIISSTHASLHPDRLGWK